MTGKGSAGVPTIWKTVAIAAMGAIAGLVLIGAGTTEGYLKDREAGIATAVGTAVLVAVGLNTLFDFFGKRDLIREFTAEIRAELARRLNGVVEAVDNAQNIEYDDRVWASDKLVIGNRGSLRMIKNYSGHIATRAQAGKVTIFVFCTEELFSSTYKSLADRENESNEIDSWVASFVSTEGVRPNTLQVLRTPNLMNYSFVASDEGVWVKLYHNSRSRVPAPAFFVQTSSPIGAAIWRDVNRLAGSRAEQ